MPRCVQGYYLLEVENDQDIPGRPTQHYTVIFNTFVMMTLFNEFNSRKIHGQRNVFEGLQRNMIFIVIWTTTFVRQILIVQYGGFAVHTTPLELDHWMWCMFFGIGVLPWAQVINSVPTSVIPKRFPWSAKKSPKKSLEVGLTNKTSPPVGYLSESEDEEGDEDEDEFDEIGNLPNEDDDISSRGQILWIRGLSRLQTQQNNRNPQLDNRNDVVYGGVRRFTLSQVGGGLPLLVSRRPSSSTFGSNEVNLNQCSDAAPKFEEIVSKSGSVDLTASNRRKQLKPIYSLPNSRHSNVNNSMEQSVNENNHINEESDEHSNDFQD